MSFTLIWPAGRVPTKGTWELALFDKWATPERPITIKKIIQVGELTGVPYFTTIFFFSAILVVPGLGLQLRVSKAGNIPKQYLT